LFSIKYNDKARIFFLKARESFDALLTSGILLEDEWYKIIMFRHALCDYKLGDFYATDTILSELSNISSENNKSFTANLFLLHGHVYYKLQKIEKAIDAYKKYLTYFPNNEDVKKRIRLLSDQLPE